MIEVPITALFGSFGQAAVVDDGQTGARNVTILFDAPFAVASEYGVGVEMTAPTALVASAEIKDVNGHGARLSTNNTDYAITGVQPDGAGLTRLELRDA